MSGPVELLRALAALSEYPVAGHYPLAEALELAAPPAPEAWQVAHTDLFLQQCPPYASIYLGNEGAMGGVARERVADLWRLLRLRVPAEPDHLAAMLALYANLCRLAARDGRWQHLRHAVLWEHLLAWMPFYLERVEDLGEPPYPAWSRMLREVLRAEATDTAGPRMLPLHLREAEPGAPPGGSTAPDAIAAVLLAPVRSGVVLCRRELGTLAADLGLGVRTGDRRRMLCGLLEQDRDAARGALAGMAREQARRHGHRLGWLGPAGRFWQERADATAAWLETLDGTGSDAGGARPRRGLPSCEDA